MWEDSIRLELLASGMVRAIKACGKSRDNSAFQDIYRDLRIEFPTLSEREIWQVIGLCTRVYEKKE